MVTLLSYDELYCKSHALHYLQNRLEEADQYGYTSISLHPHINIRVIKNSALYKEIQSHSKALNTELVAYAATHPYTGNKRGGWRCGMKPGLYNGARSVKVNAVWYDGKISCRSIIIYNFEGRSNIYDFNTLTLREVEELANKIALEKAEKTRATFINQLISEYHASIAV